MEENNKQENKNNVVYENNEPKESIQKEIPFYKKIGYSIGKINKYNEMATTGWKKAVKYLAILMIILGAILSAVSTYDTYQYVEETYAYLNENIPECEYKDGILTTNNEGKVELEHTFLTKSFGGKLIVDTKTEDETTINEYTASLGENIGYVLLKDKIIVINLGEQGNQTFSYPDFFSKYFNYDINQFNKQDILNYIQSQGNGYLTYYLEYLLVYSLVYFIVFSIYIFVATLIIFIFSKILKIKYKLPEIYTLTIYGFTLPIILFLAYMIISYFTKFTIPYAEQIMVVIGTLYSIAAVYKGKEK